MLRKFLIQLGEFSLRQVESFNPWTNVYGLARTLLAAGTCLTLIFNSPGILFRPAAGIDQFPVCQGLGPYGIFCLANPYLELARWGSVFALIIIASGWRPRITALPHWWISFSLQNSAITIDGGDQITAVLTFLLIPLALTDNRRWHWQAESSAQPTNLASLTKLLIAFSTILAIRFQMFVVYFHAATAKLAMEEWLNGTVLYYWLIDPVVGLPDWLRFMTPLLSSSFVVLLTWGTLVLEIILFMALFAPKRWWKALLISGIIFHAGIAVTMGLVTFGLAMFAGLILYLRPADEEFSFSSAWLLGKKSFRNMWPYPVKPIKESGG